jgi:diguanylate cyclase (GGDEF)-like protein
MTPSAGLAPPRAALGSARETRSRLPAPRSRPLLVALYALLLGEDGWLGPAARRRAARVALKSMPAAVALGGWALVALGTFGARGRGLLQACGGATLAATFAAAAWRRTALARQGKRADARDLEVGALAIVLAHAAAQASQARLALDAQPLVYLAVAMLVAAFPRGVSVALIGVALALEAARWSLTGAPRAELPGVAARAVFVAAFALLYHCVLGLRMAAGRKAEEAAVERRRRELDDRARELRLLASAADPGEGDRAERAARLAEAAVLETEAASRGLLQIATSALGAHTAAVWLLTEDDAELRMWDCSSGSDRVAQRLPAGEGPLGGVVKRRAPVRLHGDVRAANHYDDGRRPKAFLAVPLLSRSGAHLRGVVLADRLELAPFTDGDERLLAAVAAELARAAAAERLICDGRASREEKERFYQAIEGLNRTTTPREVFDAVLESAAEMVEVDFGAVTLFEEMDGKPRHRVARATLAPGRGQKERDEAAAQDRAAASLEGREFPDNGGLVACAVRLASSLPGRDLKVADAVVFDEATRMKGLLSLKVLPLRAGESVLGTIVLGARRAGAYHGDAVRQLEVVAMQAGDSILRARLFEATERLATTDGLTGLLNHRTFQARLDEHLAAARRYGKKVSLLLTDIDHFKAVNDTYGHPAGDRVLKEVARILQREARTTDVVARYGGEEFALVMPETDEAGAMRTAERVRERVAQAAISTGQGELRVTLSVGVATFPRDAKAKPDLIERADAGLYHAKRHGRNRSVALGAARAGCRPG